MERLCGHVQHYAWGHKGYDSLVARLCAAAGDNGRRCDIDEKLPYAELWIGTHHNGPARLHGSNRALCQYGHDDDGSGPTMALENNGGTEEAISHLSFILKVMSVRRTLSLQTHPNKLQAKWLHRRDPLHYPDENHKPEMLVALTRFELLCGFRPLAQLRYIFAELPQLQHMMGKDNVAALFCDDGDANAGNADPPVTVAKARALRRCVRALLSCPEQVYLPKFEQITRKLYECAGSLSACTVDACRAFKKLRAQYANDVACAGAFLLNAIALRPGQACFYDANVPHAYMSGDCIECVSRSNNTVRAGLTDKYTNADDFATCLDYAPRPSDYYIIKPIAIAPAVTLFDTPEKDFQVIEVASDKGSARGTAQIEISSEHLSTPSVFIVIEGCALLEYGLRDWRCGADEGTQPVNGMRCTLLRRGHIYFVHSALNLTITVTERPFLAYFACERAG